MRNREKARGGITITEGVMDWLRSNYCLRTTRKVAYQYAFLFVNYLSGIINTRLETRPL